MGFEKNPANLHGYAYAILGIVFLVITSTTVTLRILARLKLKSIGLDDLFMVFAQFGMIAFSLAAIALHIVVPGKMPTSYPSHKLAANWLIVNEASFSAGSLFLKLSLGTFFLRLIADKKQRMIVYAAMALSTVVNGYLFFLGIFTCGSPKDFLIKYLLRKCVPKRVLLASAFVQCAANTITDCTFALIPFLLLRRSLLPKSIKIYVGGVLTLATIGCIASIVRFWYIDKLFLNTSMLYNQISFLGIVGLVELGIGITASSVPTLRPLFRSCMGHTASMYNKSSRKATVENSTGSPAGGSSHELNNTRGIHVFKDVTFTSDVASERQSFDEERGPISSKTVASKEWTPA